MVDEAAEERPTVSEWLASVEAAARGCASRREAAVLVRRTQAQRTERVLSADGLARIWAVYLDLYRRFWS